MGLEGFALLPGPGGGSAAFGQKLQNGLPPPGRLGGGLLGQGFADARPQLVVQPQKQFPVPGVLGKADEVGEVPHHPVGEKGTVHLAAGVGNALALQQVDEGQGAVVVPVEYRRGHCAVPGHLAQVAVLGPAVQHRDLPHGGAVLPHRLHVLGVAGGVFLNKLVCRRHDLGGGAVVLLQIEDLGAGVVLLKASEGLGVGGPEAVDTLVLVAHQKQVSRPGGQQADDAVLDFGGVLGLVHAEILVLVLDRLQHPGKFPQNLKGVDHLVVVVHASPLAQGLDVAVVEGGKVHPFHLHLVQFLPGEHLVFHIGKGGFQRFDGAVRGELPCLRPVELPQQGGLLSAVLQQAEGGAAKDLLIVADDAAAHPVDGAEFQQLGGLLAEEAGETGPHVPGGGHRVGHGEDALRGHAPDVAQVADAGHQHRGLAAARHCQQQHRPLPCPHRSLLLGVELGGQPGKKLCLLHDGP